MARTRAGHGTAMEYPSPDIAPVRHACRERRPNGIPPAEHGFARTADDTDGGLPPFEASVRDRDNSSDQPPRKSGQFVIVTEPPVGLRRHDIMAFRAECHQYAGYARRAGGIAIDRGIAHQK